ncbi:MAG: rhamnogalacturonan lyase, partial [Microbacterium sp.]
MENSAFWRRRGTRWGACVVAASLAFAIPNVALAAQADDRPADLVTVPSQFEKNLDRGLAAATTDDGVFVSWRLLGSETTGATGASMTGPNFALYRDGEPIATVTDSTNYLDPHGDSSSEYAVAPIVNDVELERSEQVTPWGGQYASIPIQKPEGGRM